MPFSKNVRYVILAAILCASFAAVASPADTTQKATAQPQTQSRPTSEPYAGDLSIFEYKDRDKKLQINRVMDLLGITNGKAVADIGAGSGWFSALASKRVGMGGVVYAEDINPTAINYIGRRVKKEELHNVEPILGTPDDPKLPPESVNAVLILKTYHEIANPIALMKNLRPALISGGRIGIIDKNGNGTDHGIMPNIIEREMAQAGFKRIAKYDFTKADGEDYFLIFTRK
jgi:predicted methyltransferase